MPSPLESNAPLIDCSRCSREWGQHRRFASRSFSLLASTAVMATGLGIAGCYVGPEYIVKVKDPSLLTENRQKQYARHGAIESSFGQYIAGVGIGTDLESVTPVPTDQTGEFGWTFKAMGSETQTVVSGGYATQRNVALDPMITHFHVPASNLQEVRKRPRWLATFGANLGIVSIVPTMYGLSHFKDADKLTDQDRTEMKPFLIAGIAGMVLGTVFYFWDMFAPVANGQVLYSAPQPTGLGASPAIAGPSATAQPQPAQSKPESGECSPVGTETASRTVRFQLSDQSQLPSGVRAVFLDDLCKLTMTTTFSGGHAVDTQLQGLKGHSVVDGVRNALGLTITITGPVGARFVLTAVEHEKVFVLDTNQHKFVVIAELGGAARSGAASASSPTPYSGIRGVVAGTASGSRTPSASSRISLDGEPMDLGSVEVQQ
jgi:hypothetical protein